MASETSSLKSTSSKVKTPSDGGKRVGFARPTLIIPPPQANAANSHNQYSANLVYTAGIAVSPEVYGKKPSMFMFNQLSDIRDFTMNTAKSGLGIGEKWSFWMYNKLKAWSKQWFTHFFLSLVIVLYTVGGALTFIEIEGGKDDLIIEPDIRGSMYELIKTVTNLSDELSDEEWNEQAKLALDTYKSTAIQAHIIENLKQTYDNQGDGKMKLWTMMNAVVYCATVYTSIGYGHLFPKTNTGKAVTVVYALIGIPLFLIVLTDFGKLFTRCIKFLWSFVRRLYYTGSCKKVRKTAHVQEIFKGAQMMYEIATFRRPSTVIDPEDPHVHIPPQFPSVVTTPNQVPATPLASLGASLDTDTPTTPALSNFEIDDEFNLPITVALFILLSYIFVGALIYCMWEGWDFFASFYFVFISMSTIGFGDYVPRNPICMIVSIVYLVFGLALMSMCINVVQEKLSDTFKQASAKLGATIGFQVDDDGSVATVPPENVELPGVHDPAAVIDIDSIKPTINNVTEKQKLS